MITPAFVIFDEVTGNRVQIAQGSLVQDPSYPNVWRVTIEGLEIKRPTYLRVVFHIEDTVNVAVDPSRPTPLPLAKWIDQEEILFVGRDRRDRRDQIVAFARVAGLG